VQGPVIDNAAITPCSPDRTCLRRGGADLAEGLADGRHRPNAAIWRGRGCGGCGWRCWSSPLSPGTITVPLAIGTQGGYWTRPDALARTLPVSDQRLSWCLDRLATWIKKIWEKRWGSKAGRPGRVRITSTASRCAHHAPIAIDVSVAKRQCPCWSRRERRAANALRVEVM